MWEGVETKQKCNILTPTFTAISLVSFSFSWCSTGGPGAQLSAECWLSLPHLVTNGSGLQTNWGSRGPLLPGGGFLYLFFSDFSFLQLTDFLSSPSYIIVQSPTQSLEWHVWSSSSGNSCHAVHRSLSSGAWVYECTMGFLPCPIFFNQAPPYAISSYNCHRNVSLPSGASLWNGMFILTKVPGFLIKKCFLVRENNDI